MESFLRLKKEDGAIYEMKPGTLRNINVAVGNHIAPEYSKIPSMLQNMLHLYDLEKHRPQIRQIIGAMASHHRLSWIHPFADGNGRTTRLMLDALLGLVLGNGYGLWNISRGLARNIDQYRHHLKMADLQKIDAHDGKGYLSERYLHDFVSFMLDIALDQIDYMSECLRLDNLANRIDGYVAYRRTVMMNKKDKMPKDIESVLKELLLKGEIRRGEVQKIIGVSARTANSIVSWMLKDEIVSSPSKKGVLHINFNSKMSSYLFPALVPNATI